jgi:hypothetical protein
VSSTTNGHQASVWIPKWEDGRQVFTYDIKLRGVSVTNCRRRRACSMRKSLPRVDFISYLRAPCLYHARMCPEGDWRTPWSMQLSALLPAAFAAHIHPSDRSKTISSSSANVKGTMVS